MRTLQLHMILEDMEENKESFRQELWWMCCRLLCILFVSSIFFIYVQGLLHLGKENIIGTINLRDIIG